MCVPKLLVRFWLADWLADNAALAGRQCCHAAVTGNDRQLEGHQQYADAGARATRPFASSGALFLCVQGA